MQTDRQLNIKTRAFINHWRIRFNFTYIHGSCVSNKNKKNLGRNGGNNNDFRNGSALVISAAHF